jgi:hypothetical protein
MSKVRFVDSNITISPGAGSGGGSSISSSYALSSSHADFATSASYAEYAVSASHEIVKEVSSSYADFALSSSHATTASYALNAGGSGIFTQTGSYYATTNDLQITGSIITTDSLTNKGYVYIGGGTTLQAGTVAALYLGTSNGGMDIARYNDSSLVLGGITQQYGWRLFGIKHGLNSNTYTTEIDNLIATGSMNVSGSIDISLKSGSAFTITEDDVDQENRLTFEYENGDPTLIIAGRSAESSLHLKYNLAGEGLKITNQGLITKQVSGVEYGLRLSINSFQPETGNQLDLGYYNDRWKTLYLYSGNKVSWGTTINDDLASIRHTLGTSKLTITGSSDVTLDVKGDIISTGSLLVSGSVDIAIPSGSAFTITETDKDQKGRLDFTFDDGDPTLEIEGRSSVAKIVLSNNDGESNNLKIQSDGQVYASSVGPYTGSIKFLPNGIEAISVGTSNSPFIGSQTRPFYKYYMAQVGGQFISKGSYSLQQFFLNSSATGTQRSDGLYNQSSGIRIVVSGSEISGADGYLRNPNNQYFQIQDDSTGTGNDASIPFRVGKSGSLAINLNQSKGFGFTQYYTASAMVHVEAEPNYDLNLFQGNDVLGNNVFEVDRDGNLTVDAEISASGDLYARDGRFSRDGGAAEIEIIASEIAGGIIGTQTSDNLLFRRFNINKFTISQSRNVSNQRLDVEGQVSASTYLGDGSQLTNLPETNPKYLVYQTGSGTNSIKSISDGTNIASGNCSVVGGGSSNTSEATGSFIGGGINNSIITDGGNGGTCSVIGGGKDNCVSGQIFQTITGGCNNKVTGQVGFIGGGCQNQTGTGAGNSIVGGRCHTIADGLNNVVIGGGFRNTVSGDGSGILGGIINTANAESSFIVGTGITSTVFNHTHVNNLTTLGNITASAGTVSASAFIGDGSQLTNLPTQDPFPYTGDAIISGSLTISGSLLNTGTVSINDTDSPYTLTGTQQFVLIDPSGGDVTVNMPDAATYPGREIRFKLTQAAGANTVTLQRQGADTIDGATTYTDLDIQYESISTVSDGSTGWFIF